MELFPYPAQVFSCHFRDEDSLSADEALDKFLGPMNLRAGTVQGETGIPGLKLDFRVGLRLVVPRGDYHVRITDGETGQVLFDEDLSEVTLLSQEIYFLPWHVEVFLRGRLVFAHDFSVAGQPLHIEVETCALGDTLALLPAVQALARRHEERVTVMVAAYLRPLVAALYPSLSLWCEERPPVDAYAIAYLGVPGGGASTLPLPWTSIPMLFIAHLTMGGRQELERPPVPAWPRPVAEPYVCIGVQASHTVKGWLWPGGWEEVVSVLRQAGYRVLCIDKAREQTELGFRTRLPEGAEDFTGDRPLTERAQLLAHAEFFVGLSSGLAWLAWTVHCPVVMIAGFSLPWFEFPEAERAYNPRVCCGCIHEGHLIRDKCADRGEDYMACQRRISPQMVLDAIVRLMERKARGEKF